MKLLQAEHRWVCPNCQVKDVTFEAQPHTRFHQCAGLKGLEAPLVPEGTRCRIYTVERQDFIGNEIVRRDEDGRPIMAAITERDDGQDCTVYAPTAILKES